MANRSQTDRGVYIRRLQRDFFVIFLSILIGAFFVHWGLLKEFLLLVQGAHMIGAFFAGIFFTSAFTIAPASIALFEIAKTTSPVLVAFWAAFGAVLGDLVIFLFLRDAFAADLIGFVKTSHYKKIISFFHLGFIKWLSPILGALIIASPLPDEFGLAMMGLSKVKTVYLIPISFAMNFLGALALALVAVNY